MKKYFTLKRGETFVYILVWILVFLMPVFIYRNNSTNYNQIYKEWVRMLPFLVIFFINNHLLLPKLLFQKKNLWYFGILLLSIILISYLSTFSHLLFDNQMPQNGGMRIPPQPGGMGGHDPSRMMPGFEMNRDPFRQLPRAKGFLDRKMIDNFIVCILVVGLNSAIKISSKWQKEEQKRKEVEKQNLKNELAFLRNQVSPHFFMNTLNNIHALVDIDGDNAKEAIIKLSKMMRYLLYDSDEGETTLAKEVEFIQSYLDLMKLRYPADVKLTFSFQENLPAITIPPLLFTSLIENAFKHGISSRGESFVDIYLRMIENQLVFRIRNSSFGIEKKASEVGGLGLANLKKRLDLIYGETYTIISKDENGIFEIAVKIPLHDH